MEIWRVLILYIKLILWNVLGYKSFTMIIFIPLRYINQYLCKHFKFHSNLNILPNVLHKFPNTTKIWFNVGSNTSLLLLQLLWLLHNIYGLIAIWLHNIYGLMASLAKWLSVHLQTKWSWVRVPLQSLKLHISHLLRARSSLTFRQLWSVESLWNAYMTWTYSNIKVTALFYKEYSENEYNF